MKKFSILLITFICSFANAQEKKEDSFGVKLKGYIKTDFFMDSREVEELREEHFLVYPKNKEADINGDDINANPSTNFLSIQSRFTALISAPDAFGAKTSGVLEADFFGNGTDVNGLRLRHAFVKMNWKSTELLMGQYWHPMFIAESFPDVISFNTGVPFQPFARNPQVRLSQNLGNFKCFVSAATQRDFASTGPAGISSVYLRNSAIPNLHAQVQYKPDSTMHLFGIGVDYKTLLPQTSTTGTAGKTISNEQIQSISAIAYGKLEFKKFVVKVEGVYAQNPYDLTMIGGYAATTAPDALTGKVKYTNTSTASAWCDMNTKGKKVQFGLFAGVTKNLGSNDSISGTYYARGNNIDHVYRVAPRIVFIAGKLNLAVEVEHTAAAYGTVNAIGKVEDEKVVANTRALFSCIYKF